MSHSSEWSETQPGTTTGRLHKGALLWMAVGPRSQIFSVPSPVSENQTKRQFSRGTSNLIETLCENESANGVKSVAAVTVKVFLCV